MRGAQDVVRLCVFRNRAMFRRGTCRTVENTLKIAMLGHKRIPSREGGIEIVVGELSTRMVRLGHKVTCFNRGGHHVSGSEFDGEKLDAYK